LTCVERAILLGALRKYFTVLQNGRGTPISSLHYFTKLFEEVPAGNIESVLDLCRPQGKHLRANMDWFSG